MMMSSLGLLATSLLSSQSDESSIPSEYADMPALRGKDYGKTKMKYPDYTETNSGLQYKLATRPRVARLLYFSLISILLWALYEFRLGSQEVIPALEEAVSGMSLGGIRRVVVSPELGYPDNDYNRKGPRPTTFSVLSAM